MVAVRRKDLRRRAYLWGEASSKQFRPVYYRIIASGKNREMECSAMLCHAL
jgi:hypothetical protein